jgi:hypothetical protein
MSADVNGDSPQAVALKLAQAIASSEGKPIGSSKSDRAYTLQLYKECIEATLHIRKWGPYT